MGVFSNICDAFRRPRSQHKRRFSFSSVAAAIPNITISSPSLLPSVSIPSPTSPSSKTLPSWPLSNPQFASAPKSRPPATPLDPSVSVVRYVYGVDSGEYVVGTAQEVRIRPVRARVVYIRKAGQDELTGPKKKRQLRRRPAFRFPNQKHISMDKRDSIDKRLADTPGGWAATPAERDLPPPKVSSSGRRGSVVSAMISHEGQRSKEGGPRAYTPPPKDRKQVEPHMRISIDYEELAESQMECERLMKKYRKSSAGRTYGLFKVGWDKRYDEDDCDPENIQWWS